MRKLTFRRRPGEGTPMILAIVLVLLMLFCAIAEYSRVPSVRSRSRWQSSTFFTMPVTVT